MVDYPEKECQQEVRTRDKAREKFHFGPSSRLLDYTILKQGGRIKKSPAGAGQFITGCVAYLRRFASSKFREAPH